MSYLDGKRERISGLNIGKGIFVLIGAVLCLLFAQSALSKERPAVAGATPVVHEGSEADENGVGTMPAEKSKDPIVKDADTLSEDVLGLEEQPIDLETESEEELQLIVEELKQKLSDAARAQNELRKRVRESGRKAYETEKDLEKLEDPKLIELRKRLEAAELECYRIRVEYMELLNSKPQVQESVKEQQELSASMNAGRIESRRLQQKLMEAKQRLRRVRELNKKSEK